MGLTGLPLLGVLQKRPLQLRAKSASKKICLPFGLLSILIANCSIRHYSYECKANAQERPYVSRPSRTQQLSNPKLVPKLTSDVPQDLLKKYVFLLAYASMIALPSLPPMAPRMLVWKDVVRLPVLVESIGTSHFWGRASDESICSKFSLQGG